MTELASVGSWVTDNHDGIAKVKNVWPATPDSPASYDLILYARSGDRIGRRSPAMGGPRNFEPCCDSDLWFPIKAPAFPLDKYAPLFRTLKYIREADRPHDDGRL